MQCGFWRARDSQQIGCFGCAATGFHSRRIGGVAPGFHSSTRQIAPSIPLVFVVKTLSIIVAGAPYPLQRRVPPSSSTSSRLDLVPCLPSTPRPPSAPVLLNDGARAALHFRRRRAPARPGGEKGGRPERCHGRRAERREISGRSGASALRRSGVETAGAVGVRAGEKHEVGGDDGARRRCHLGRHGGRQRRSRYYRRGQARLCLCGGADEHARDGGAPFFLAGFHAAGGEGL